MAKHAHTIAGPQNLEKTLSNPADMPQKSTGTAFKNNDQLKTNTALQMEAAKIEFKAVRRMNKTMRQLLIQKEAACVCRIIQTV